MSSIIPERRELAKLCRSKDWSKAIRVLDSIITRSCLIQDICNRAFCYSQLELHKHVIKDCDRVLRVDPTLLQAHILKGHALSALGRKWDALLVWEQGYECAICQSADLKLLLELEEYLAIAKHDKCLTRENSSVELLGSVPTPGSGTHKLSKLNETHNNSKELTDTPESHCQSNGASEIHMESNDKAIVLKEILNEAKEHMQSDSQLNGTDYLLHKRSSIVGSSSEVSDASEGKSSNGSSDRASNSCYSYQTCSYLNDEAMMNKMFAVTRISETKSLSMDLELSRAIVKVNEGKYSQAISIFNQMLKESPTYPEALIGRGTAYAFRRELDAAIADFTKAIHFNPLAAEAWKRRGQARAALGEYVEAIGDLTKALEFEPDSADILHERGIVRFKFKDFNSSVDDLSLCVKLDNNNSSAYTFLGLALSSIGKYEMAEEAHYKSIQVDGSFVEAWAHLAQFYRDQANPTKALECLDQILKLDRGHAKAYHLRGLLFHGIGNHQNAIQDLSMGLSIEKSNIELLYLRASCYHAIGEYTEAVKDYDAALDMELDSMDKFVLQCLAFYQKEIALYTASKIHSEFCWFDIDGDIDPLFKEYWCKRLHPKNVCEKVFRQPTLRCSLRKCKLKRQDFSITKQTASLLHAADTLGEKIQYNCPGFLPNRRQHRMAGLAVFEIAQRVSKAWRSIHAEWKCLNKNTSKCGKKARRKEKNNVTSQNRGGSCCSTSGSLEKTTSYCLAEDKPSSNNVLPWKDVYSIAARWRQISEPCDPVVWVNRLSEEFNAGFGSHTPIILGQARVVRYFPNYQRTFDVAKSVMMEKAHVNDKADNIVEISQDEKIQEIMNANSCSELYEIVGKDFWLSTYCNSAAFEGKQLEGTRITLVKNGELGFDFAIRTPCTPSRWDDYDAEMTMAWEAICSAYCGETYGSTDFDLLENTSDAILRMTYFWYNFMPLSRGSAAVGFVVLLGVLLAGNMKFMGNIPEGVQVDWEAILGSDPNGFVDSIKGWVYPSLEVTSSWKDYPDVASTFPTTGSVVAALSSYDS